MKALYTLLIFLFPFLQSHAQEFVLPPFSTDVPCYDGSAYVLDVRLKVTGVRVVNVYSDNGTSGSFSFELLFEYINLFTGTVGTGATSFYTYDVTFYSDNPNLASPQISNNLPVPLVTDTGDNISLHNNNTYTGSPSAMGLAANTTYNSQSVIDLFGFDSVYVNLGAPCLTATGTAVPAVPLPVTLSAFSVARNGDALILNWRTRQERNNKGFQLQRSQDGKDWSNLVWVNTQAQNGNGNEELNYTNRDQAPALGDNIYRLLQTDLDGRTEISKTVRYNFTNSNNSNSGILAYPVPANGLLKVRYTDPGLIPDQVSLYDMTGKKSTRL